ncbi:MAG: glycosyltransferase family 9 protein [Armatimonadetes bacterium]|nr:glycosyltransferase family 9 protein [Armatimonadota bacterium]
MKRYRGEALRPNPRLALVTNDNLGNFVITTPLMQMLRARHGGTLDYYGGTRVMELAEPSDLVDRAFPLHGCDPREAARELAAAEYDLVVNVEWTTWAKTATALLSGPGTFVCGPCLGEEGRSDMPFPDDETGNLWNDQEWLAEDITGKYRSLDSGWIAEIFCRLAYLEGPVPGYKLPTVAPTDSVPDVWVSASASLPEKLWPLENWLVIIAALKSEGLRVGLLGAKPSNQTKYWKGGSDEDKLVEAGVEDHRGAFSLPGVVGAISAAKLVVTLDNGILHLASATPTRLVGLFREGIHRLWAPPNPNLRVIHPGPEEAVSSISTTAVMAAIHASRS